MVLSASDEAVADQVPDKQEMCPCSQSHKLVFTSSTHLHHLMQIAQGPGLERGGSRGTQSTGHDNTCALTQHGCWLGNRQAAKGMQRCGMHTEACANLQHQPVHALQAQSLLGCLGFSFVLHYRLVSGILDRM